MNFAVAISQILSNYHKRDLTSVNFTPQANFIPCY